MLVGLGTQLLFGYWLEVTLGDQRLPVAPKIRSNSQRLLTVSYHVCFHNTAANIIRQPGASTVRMEPLKM